MRRIAFKDEKVKRTGEKKLPKEITPSTAMKLGAAGRIRTHDPLVRSQILYPTELQPLARNVF